MPSAGLAAGEIPVYKKGSSTLLSLDPAKNLIFAQPLSEPWRVDEFTAHESPHLSAPRARARAGDGTGSKTIGAIVPWSARRSGTEKRLTIWAHLCDKLTITICTLVGKVRRLSAICQINLSHTRLKFKVGHPERVLTLLRLLISYRLILLL